MRKGYVAALAGILGLAGTSGAAPDITGVIPDRSTVPRYERLELTVGLAGTYANPFDPDQIDIGAEFASPSGKAWKVNAFWDGTAFRVRFAANETGTWTYRVDARDSSGSASSPVGSFTVSSSEHHGWVRIAPNRRYFLHDDGTAFHGMGLGYPWNVKEEVLDSLVAAGGTSIVYWNSTFDWEGNQGGRYLLESMESGLGRYDLRKGERVDQLLQWCEARGLTLIFCIWPHGFLGDEINPGRLPGHWEAYYDQNPYSTLVKARDFFDNPQAWEYQKKLYRYMVARWSYSRSLEHWWTLVEGPGTDAWAFRGPAVVEAWARKMQDWFALNDPFRHPVSGSQQGNADNFWTNGYRIFDVANREIYFNGSHFTSVTQETEKLWTQFEKPILVGEIGNFINVKTFHQAIWAGLAGGAAGAPYWWNYPDMWAPEKWDQLKAYSGFARGLPLGALTGLKRVKPAVSGAVALAIQADQASFGWIVNEKGQVGGKAMELSGLLPGAYRLEWYDTWKGEVVSSTRVNPAGGKLSLPAPATANADIAFRLVSENLVGLGGGDAGRGRPGPQGIGLARRGRNLWITPAEGRAYRAELLRVDGTRVLERQAARGEALRLDLEAAARASSPGVHFLRILWDGGNRVEALVL